MSSCATCGRGKKHFGLIDLPSEIKFLWRVASNACISTYLLRTHFRYTATSYPIYLLHPVPYVFTGSLFVKPVNKISNITVLHKRSEWWRVHPFDVALFCANIFWFNSSKRFSDEVSTLFYGALHNHKLASWLLVKHILLVNKEESSLVTLFFLHPPNEVSAINKRTCSVLWLCFVLLHFVFVKP